MHKATCSFCNNEVSIKDSGKILFCPNCELFIHYKCRRKTKTSNISCPSCHAEHIDFVKDKPVDLDEYIKREKAKNSYYEFGYSTPVCDTKPDTELMLNKVAQELKNLKMHNMILGILLAIGGPFFIFCGFYIATNFVMTLTNIIFVILAFGFGLGACLLAFKLLGECLIKGKINVPEDIVRNYYSAGLLSNPLKLTRIINHLTPMTVYSIMQKFQPEKKSSEVESYDCYGDMLRSKWYSVRDKCNKVCGLPLDAPPANSIFKIVLNSTSTDGCLDVIVGTWCGSTKRRFIIYFRNKMVNAHGKFGLMSAYPDEMISLREPYKL